VADGANGGVLVAGTHRELVAVELAQSDHALRRQLGHDGGVKRRLVVVQNARAGRGGEILGHKNIFVRHGHAFQRAGRAVGDAGIGGSCLGQCGLWLDGDKRAQVGVRVGAVQEVLGDLDGRYLLGSQGLGQGMHAQVVQFV